LLGADFYAQNQIPGDIEHLHFNSTYRVREGEHAAILGYPLFLGLNVGNDGLFFKCYTVNVKNDEDDAFLSFLEWDVFRAELKLAKSAPPAIAPFSNKAYNLTRSTVKRNRYVAVQEFHLGLDFSPNAIGARLAEGSYIAVQIPENMQLSGAGRTGSTTPTRPGQPTLQSFLPPWRRQSEGRECSTPSPLSAARATTALPLRRSV
jgi:hypothetical protein